MTRRALRSPSNRAVRHSSFIPDLTLVYWVRAGFRVLSKSILRGKWRRSMLNRRLKISIYSVLSVASFFACFGTGSSYGEIISSDRRIDWRPGVPGEFPCAPRSSPTCETLPTTRAGTGRPMTMARSRALSIIARQVRSSLSRPGHTESPTGSGFPVVWF